MLKKINVHHTSVIDEGWNGSEASKCLLDAKDAAYFASAFAYQDGNLDAHIKSSYKFLHHAVSTDGTVGAANANACVLAISKLNTDSEDLSLSAEERNAAYLHVAAHLKDADMVPPALAPVVDAADIVERVYCSATFGKVDGPVAKGALAIRGFASVNSLDRDGDVINPTKFDVDTFMKNPQLWFNHSPYYDGKGNSKAIGKVIEAVPVEVVLDGDTLKLRYLTGENAGLDYRADLSTLNYSVTAGMHGLWVVAEVLEKEIQDQITEGRLNAFSWQGIIHRNKSGTVSSIDLMEVSVVIIPANQRATFQIGKMLHMEDRTGKVTVIDLAAIASLSGTCKTVVPLTEAEQSLLAAQDVVGIQKGGEDMDKVLEMLAKMNEALTELSTSSKAMTERLDTLETVATKEGEPVVEPGAAAPATPAVAETVEAPAAEATPAAPVAPVAPVATKEDAPVADTAALEKLTAALTEKLGVVDELSTALATQNARLARLEGTPAKSTVPAEGNGTAAADLNALVAKAMSDLTPEQRRAVEKKALQRSLIPEQVVS